MTGLWDQEGVPHKGWWCSSIEDLEDDRMFCEMCRGAEIRYAHNMSHPEYPETLSVGRECAANMEADYSAAKDRERKFLNRKKWVKSSWKIGFSGSTLYYYKNTKGLKVRIYCNQDRWKPWVLHRETSRTWKPERLYDSLDDAMEVAYDKYLEWKN